MASAQASVVPILSTRKDGVKAVRQRLQRTTFDPLAMAEVENQVRTIIAAVRRRGDDALVDMERQFGWKGCTRERLRVSDAEVKAALAQVSPKVLDALRVAHERLEQFHRRQVPSAWFVHEDGAMLGQLVQPVERVGIYVPGGLAAYPSTVLHVAVPAKVAGVREICLATPPDERGTIAPVVLAAAHLVGVHAVFRIGGAHAIAAFAFGTETVPKVDKIAGPGGIYPVVAKRLLFGVVGIDLLPGPSEVAVIADEAAPPEWVAMELLAQAEHGPDSVAVLFTPSEKLLCAVAATLQRQLQRSPRRRYLEPALREHGALVLTRDLDEAIALVNDGAFEHVALMVTEPMAWVGKVRHAGAVFVGVATSVAFGDYLAGPSHVLPTAGTARFASGLSVHDFVRRTSLVMLSAEKSRELAEIAAVLADAEGLPAHAQTLRLRRSIARRQRQR